ncbi:hypothetical protein [Tunturiibacter gelidoferens]|uniref:Uncharacterized protein n=1 Tax=Tunturiibacter gelidiferens TaxID=3069689 RepID=A0ACC5NWS2_9BACT|nr:hypothetical protein [Edaphobacter lichenicola]MBB5338998.1 hypothetical protein [Edaphobacter lichenicola]
MSPNADLKLILGYVLAFEIGTVKQARPLLNTISTLFEAMSVKHSLKCDTAAAIRAHAPPDGQLKVQPLTTTPTHTIMAH